MDWGWQCIVNITRIGYGRENRSLDTNSCMQHDNPSFHFNLSYVYNTCTSILIYLAIYLGCETLHGTIPLKDKLLHRYVSSWCLLQDINTPPDWNGLSTMSYKRVLPSFDHSRYRNWPWLPIRSHSSHLYHFIQITINLPQVIYKRWDTVSSPIYR